MTSVIPRAHAAGEFGLQRFIRSSQRFRQSFKAPTFSTADVKIDLSQDYYADLKLTRQATQDDVKQAYIKAMKEYHPDRNMERSEREQLDVKTKFLRAQEAHSVLGNTENRKRYEDLQKMHSRPHAGQDGPGVGHQVRQAQREQWDKDRQSNIYYQKGEHTQPFESKSEPGLNSQQYLAIGISLGTFLVSFLVYQWFSSPRAKGARAIWSVKTGNDKRTLKKSLDKIYGIDKGIGRSMVERSSRRPFDSYTKSRRESLPTTTPRRSVPGLDDISISPEQMKQYPSNDNLTNEEISRILRTEGGWGGQPTTPPKKPPIWD